VISQRAHGLSIGVNLNPDKFCNFDCVYCEVDRRTVPTNTEIDLDVLAAELENMLGRACGGRMRELPGYESVPEDLLKLKEVALSGDGEPTLCPMFAEVLQTVVHVRAKCMFPFFKLVLITNATGLHLTHVQEGLKLLTREDEIWAKLDVGTQACLEQINRPKSSLLNCPQVTLEHVMDNILALGKQRPVVIQSLFPSVAGQGPAPDEITAYAERLKELKQAGAQISLVQIYSAHRPPAGPNCGHLPLRSLSDIARHVRQITGLKTEVF
jgi:wyosine [tRNA(Phe)-imidazoG37] synthetase (radical SAM superfamily)